MNKLFEPQSGRLTVQYGPDEDTELLENPPRFTWIPASPDHDNYILQISASENFAEELTTTVEPLPFNFYTPDHALEPGNYYWRYALLEVEGEARSGSSQAAAAERKPGHGSNQAASADSAAQPHASARSSWSRTRRFTVPAGLPATPLPSRQGRYDHTNGAHPRLWLDPDGLTAFRGKVKEDPAYCGWNLFYEKSALPWMERELIPEPARYPDNKRVANLWRQMYMDCQEALYAIRHLSVAGTVLGSEEMISRAKDWLLHVVSWDAEGTTSRDYNDEAAFRVAGAIAWGYDWLYGHLTEDERKAVRSQLLRRTAQVAYHVIERSKIHRVPYDSHAVRSLSSVLVPACLAMLHEEPEAAEWLDYTLEYYACLYTPWGGKDGGWAEGPMYWTTGMAFVTEALNLLRNYTAYDFYKRPFFAKTGDFPLYCFSPDTIRASFGDQSSLGDPVSLKTGFNIRQFAGVTGSGLYQWYYEQVKESDRDPDSKFYNYGWWDFRFDEMLYRHDYPAVAPVQPDGEAIEPVKWFRDIGWAAMHHRMDDPQEHIMLLAKSSRYGSVSHSHGDQNGFLLHAFGEPLAIESGYYVAFGSTMHRNWRRQTHSTNNVLIDGKGQYAGDNKAACLEAYGVIEEAVSSKDSGYVRCNATAAYQDTVPYLKRYVREIYFFNQSYFVIVDQVDLTQPGKIDWLFHTLNRMKLNEQTFRVIGERAEMDGRFVYSSSGELTLHQHNQFTGVDPAEMAGLPEQWHLSASSRPATSHRLATLLVPMKKGDSKYVSYFLDDQDHGVHIYFTDERGTTQKVEVPKAY